MSASEILQQAEAANRLESLTTYRELVFDIARGNRELTPETIGPILASVADIGVSAKILDGDVQLARQVADSASKLADFDAEQERRSADEKAARKQLVDLQAAVIEAKQQLKAKEHHNRSFSWERIGMQKLKSANARLFHENLEYALQDTGPALLSGQDIEQAHRTGRLK